MDDPIWGSISTDAKDLVSKLLIVDPTKRITGSEIQDHPWIKFKNIKTTSSNMLASMRDMHSKRNLKPKSAKQSNEKSDSN